MNNTPPFDNDYEKRVQQSYASLGISQPAKMAAGGVVEDTGGMLNAAARNVKPKLKAEDEAYFNAHNQYATDHAAYSDAYNKWVADWNAGKTEAAYAGIAEPAAPTLPTAQGDLDINAYQAQLAAAAQNKATSRIGGIRAFANPEAYNLAGHAGVSSFEDGGEAVAVQDPRSMDLEQFLLENSRTKAGPVDVQEVRSSRGQGKYDTRVSKDVDGFQAFADVDVGGKKLSQVGASYVGRGRIGNYEVQYVYDPETKQPVITGAIRKELSPTSDVSAEGVYVPQRDGKDYYNAGIKYTKRFRNGGDVTSAAKDVLNYLKSNVVDPAADVAYEGWKTAVPSNIRFAAQTLLGDRTKPFTNKDLTEDELAGYAGIIQETEQAILNKEPSLLEENKAALVDIDKELRNRKTEFNKIPAKVALWTDAHKQSFLEEQELKRQKGMFEKESGIARRNLESLKKGKGNIQYKDYANYQNPTGIPQDLADESVNLANTIGRFNYKKTPSGDAIVNDRWDFINESDLPFVEKYEKMGPIAKYGEAIKDAYKDPSRFSLLETVPAYMGMAALGREGRDINLKIPAAYKSKKTKK
jgi:mRNA-degrading endonuclease RelE of RelBE toxin-antitoxin system